MSDFEVNKAKSETQQSNAKLEKAFDHLKDAVDSRAESVGQKREKLNDLVENKRQAAHDLVENAFESAEGFVDRQTGLIHKALNGTRGEAENFLKDMQSAIDDFSQGVQQSVSRMLGGLEDRRITTFSSLFLAGLLVGGFFSRYYMVRRSEGRADINPRTEPEMRKVA